MTHSVGFCVFLTLGVEEEAMDEGWKWWEKGERKRFRMGGSNLQKLGLENCDFCGI
ncbi:hypothetical protein LguiA_006214 [Lonicera macranthoides]